MTNLFSLQSLFRSFLDQLNVEVRGKRSFGTKYAIAKYKMFLGSLGLQKKKKVYAVISFQIVKFRTHRSGFQ